VSQIRLLLFLPVNFRAIRGEKRWANHNPVKKKMLYLFSEQNGVIAHPKIKARRAPGTEK
jgi:hypothetical protein